MKLALPIILVGIIGVWLLGPIREDSNVVDDSASIVHASGYEHEMPFIDHEVTKHREVNLIPLGHVYGGIAPHHVPTAVPLLAEFYARLAKTRTIDTFVIIGPDHRDLGSGDASVSRASFWTPFGRLLLNMQLIDDLIASQLVVNDEKPFDDHAIHSQTMLIRRIFPNAQIVPILMRSSGTNEFAEELGKRIGALANPNTFIVASVDFSHYLNHEQAAPLDEISAHLLTSMDPKKAGLAEADSPQSLVALMSAVRAMGAEKSEIIGTYNSSLYSTIDDYTTGYVLMYFGK